MIRTFMTTVAIGSLFVGGLAASHLAFAQDHGPGRDGHRGGRGGMLMMADANKDGTITKAELTAAIDARFATQDVDKDGKLTGTDRDAMRQQRIDARFTALDADKSGQISKTEFAARHEGRADKRAEAGKPGGADGGRHWGGRGRGGPGHAMMRGGPGGRDGDKDGAVSRAEFMAGPLAMFDKADANKDGIVTGGEMKAARQAMRGQSRDRKGPPPPAAPPPAAPPAPPPAG